MRILILLVAWLSGVASADDLSYLKNGKSAPSPFAAAPSMNRGEPVPIDTIQGHCKYQSGWCAGSKVSLRDQNANVVQTLIISNSDSLRFANVAGGIYSVEVVYDHNRKKKVVSNIRPGDNVEIDLDSTQK